MIAQRLGIVADDLTGAMDTSGHFASWGLSTVVALDPSLPLEADVAVINTNSRAEDPDKACEKVRQALRSLAGRLIYKKIDSTLRGNIGVELEVAMEELACQKAVVAPAFPAVGRTTVAGVLLVRGIKVAETQFANDPVSPVQESHIPSLLERSTERRAGCVAVEHINRGPRALYRKISGMPQDIVVCDVTVQFHLTCIVQAAALAKGSWLLCGSAGLARELHLLLTKVPTGVSRLETSSLPAGQALAVVGTRNEVAANQLLKARHELGLPILNLEVERFNQGNALSEGIESILREADRLLGQGRGLALCTTFSRYVPTLRQLIPTVMAEAVAAILARHNLAGLFLCGGDIAAEVCRRLSVSAIRVHGEVEPGVPIGELISCQSPGMRVVTKAGGFGTEDVLIKSMSYLEKGYLP